MSWTSNLNSGAIRDKDDMTNFKHDNFQTINPNEFQFFFCFDILLSIVHKHTWYIFYNFFKSLQIRKTDEALKNTTLF